jgi:hypothetical protein
MQRLAMQQRTVVAKPSRATTVAVQAAKKAAGGTGTRKGGVGYR